MPSATFEDLRHLRGCPERRPDGSLALEAYTLDVPPDSRRNFEMRDKATVVRCIQCGGQIELPGDQIDQIRPKLKAMAKGA